jgi:hypothetical protein
MAREPMTKWERGARREAQKKREQRERQRSGRAIVQIEILEVALLRKMLSRTIF